MGRISDSVVGTCKSSLLISLLLFSLGNAKENDPQRVRLEELWKFEDRQMKLPCSRLRERESCLKKYRIVWSTRGSLEGFGHDIVCFSLAAAQMPGH